MKKKSVFILIFLIVACMICSMVYKDDIHMFCMRTGAIIICYCVFRIGFDALRKFIKYNSGIQRIDRMTGIEFEEFLKVWFEKKGYRAELTPPSNDYGADLLLYKRILGKKELTVVQAKCHHSNIGIKAVQEVIGAMDYYKADKGIVVTNQHFSPNAVQLAKSRDVKLIDRSAFEKA